MFKKVLVSLATILVWSIGARANSLVDSNLTESVSSDWSVDGGNLSYKNIQACTTDVLQGTASIQGGFTTSSTGYASLQIVIPASMALTTDNLKYIAFGVKVVTPDPDWWFTVQIYTGGYTHPTRVINIPCSGNLATWWGSRPYYNRLEIKGADLGVLPAHEKVDRIDVQVRYLDGTASIFVDDMTVTRNFEIIWYDSQFNPPSPPPIVANTSCNPSETYFAADGTDLINADQPTLASVASDYTSTYGAGPLDVLNNGMVGNAGTITDCALDENVYSFTVTYVLNTTVNTLGYNIRQVNSIAAWSAENRMDQRIEFWYRPVGSTEFVNGGDFQYTPGNDGLLPGGGGSSLISLANPDGLSIAEAVDAVRFVLRMPSTRSFCPAWREIDVFGTPVPPGTVSSRTLASRQNAGATSLIAYTGNLCFLECYGDDTNLLNYFNFVDANHVTVKPSLHSLTEVWNDTSVHNSENSLRGIMTLFSNHTAIDGWYTADEPDGNGIPVSNCQAVYDVIKQYSGKPVYVTFCGDTANLNNVANYCNSYDVALWDEYPFGSGSGLFNHLENYTTGSWPFTINHKGWKVLTGEFIQEAHNAQKPAIVIAQAAGKVPDVTWSLRLPTKTELRFQVYYAIANQADGVSFWVYSRLPQSIAQPGAPYPYDGVQWLADIGKPMTQELETLQNALSYPLGNSVVSRTNTNIISQAYKDWSTGDYYLLAVNNTNADQSSSFTLSISSDLTFGQAQTVNESRNITIATNTFTDSFTPYQVHVYKLIKTQDVILPGDANHDKKVDVSDLGILAANYGATAGATWEKGDFTGDGKVDVSDLGILAANYGRGTSGGLDFHADAMALGLVAGDDKAVSKEDTAVSSTLGCGSAGLPLIAGLALMGLMLVKLDE